MTLRRMERYNAALMPYQKPETIREEMGGMILRLEESDREPEISRVERENAVLIKAAKERSARHKGRGKAVKPGKTAFKCVKTGIPGMVRRVKVKV